MEDSTTHGENNSRSASEKGISDTDQKKRGSGSTTSPDSRQDQESSTTPTTNPAQGSQQQFTMAPPPRPNFKATPTLAQPSTPTSKPTSQASSQDASQDLPAASLQAVQNGDHQPGAPSKHPANDKTSATPRKRSHVEVDQEPTTHDQESSDEDVEPANQIASFDWVELEQCYHHQMAQNAAEEQELYRSFNELCEVISALLAPMVIFADRHSISTSGPKPDTPTRWTEASNGNAFYENTQFRPKTLTSHQHEDANHAGAAQRGSTRKQTPAL